MSGDIQVKKRKGKGKKKAHLEALQREEYEQERLALKAMAYDTEDDSTDAKGKPTANNSGKNQSTSNGDSSGIVAKIIFMLLLVSLSVVVALILVELRGKQAGLKDNVSVVHETDEETKQEELTAPEIPTPNIHVDDDRIPEAPSPIPVLQHDIEEEYEPVEATPPLEEYLHVKEVIVEVPPQEETPVLREVIPEVPSIDDKLEVEDTHVEETRESIPAEETVKTVNILEEFEAPKEESFKLEIEEIPPFVEVAETVSIVEPVKDDEIEGTLMEEVEDVHTGVDAQVEEIEKVEPIEGDLPTEKMEEVTRVEESPPVEEEEKPTEEPALVKDAEELAVPEDNEVEDIVTEEESKEFDVHVEVADTAAPAVETLKDTEPVEVEEEPSTSKKVDTLGVPAGLQESDAATDEIPIEIKHEDDSKEEAEGHRTKRSVDDDATDDDEGTDDDDDDEDDDEDEDDVEKVKSKMLDQNEVEEEEDWSQYGKEGGLKLLTDAYLQVESLAEDVLEKDPNNAMVAQLAPHLSGVLRAMEAGQTDGLLDTLKHIQVILEDIKTRFENGEHISYPGMEQLEERETSAPEAELEPGVSLADSDVGDSAHSLASDVPVAGSSADKLLEPEPQAVGELESAVESSPNYEAIESEPVVEHLEERVVSQNLGSPVNPADSEVFSEEGLSGSEVFPEDRAGSEVFPEDRAGSEVFPEDRAGSEVFPEDRAGSEVFPEDRAGSEVFPEDRAGSEVFPEDRAGSEVFPEDRAGSEVFPEDRAGSEVFPEDRAGSEVFPEDRAGSEVFPEDRAGSEVFPEDRAGSEVFPEDRAGSEVFPEDRAGSEVFPEDRAGSEVFPEDRAGSEVFPEDRAGSEVFPEDRAGSEVFPEDRAGSEVFPEDRAGSEVFPEDRAGSEVFPEDRAGSEVFSEDRAGSEVFPEDRAGSEVLVDDVLADIESQIIPDGALHEDHTYVFPPSEEDADIPSPAEGKDPVPVDEIIPDPIYIKPLQESSLVESEDVPEDVLADIESQIIPDGALHEEHTYVFPPSEDDSVFPSPSEGKDSIPVDEVIPDPIYIKPLQESSLVESEDVPEDVLADIESQIIPDGALHEDRTYVFPPSEEDAVFPSPAEGKDPVPVDEIIPDPIYIKPLQDSSQPLKETIEDARQPVYERADITSEIDDNLREELDAAEKLIPKNPGEALNSFGAILQRNPKSARAMYGRAWSLDQLAEVERSNSKLEQAIVTYRGVLDLADEEPSWVPLPLLRMAAERCIDRLIFRGFFGKAVRVQQRLLQRFPDDLQLRNKMGVTFLLMNQGSAAKEIYEAVLQQWPDDGFAQVHYGFILKTVDNNNTGAAYYMQKGIESGAEGTSDGRFYFHLGDALQREGKTKEAYEIYDLAVEKGLFLSRYQRSLYNVDRLTSQPLWTPQQTTYQMFFRKLEENWLTIRDEGVELLGLPLPDGFRPESENLREVGDWKQYELFSRGRKITANCVKAPKTCALIENFPAAAGCRRGQVKFSVMYPNTHVYAHTGPTNCRLRAHLGLVIPDGLQMRVASEKVTWQEGKVFIFDDSWEHEVWHEGSSYRLILIVDVWHPELSEHERNTLIAI
nr:titin-like [Procambarus clarkii]